jgi:diphthine synthase
MTLHLIGLGLGTKTISIEAKEQIEICDKVYLEGYTVTFPYKKEELEKTINKKIESLQRTEVEDERILQEAKNKEIALLIYGDPYAATTHTQLQQECKKQNITCKTHHNTTILTAIGTNGLSLYKYGKTGSIPNWKEHTNKPTSFIDNIIQNKSIGAHTLLLSDIGLEFNKALEQLKIAAKEKNEEIKKILVMSQVGTTKEKIVYGNIEELKEKGMLEPFCIIIPGTLNHTEKEILEKINKN